MKKAISDQDKRKLCEQLVDRPLQVLTQLDGFANRDPFLDPTGTGVAITGCEAEEFFKAAWEMRLFIKPETSRDDALALLDGMRDWIARSTEWPMFKPDDGLPGKGYSLYNPPEASNGAADDPRDFPNDALKQDAIKIITSVLDARRPPGTEKPVVLKQVKNQVLDEGDSFEFIVGAEDSPREAPAKISKVQYDE